MTQITGFNLKGCSSTASGISSRPTANEFNREDFRIAATVIHIIRAATIMKGMIQMAISITPFIIECPFHSDLCISVKVPCSE